MVGFRLSMTSTSADVPTTRVIIAFDIGLGHVRLRIPGTDDLAPTTIVPIMLAM